MESAFTNPFYESDDESIDEEEDQHPQLPINNNQTQTNNDSNSLSLPPKFVLTDPENRTVSLEETSSCSNEKWPEKRETTLVSFLNSKNCESLTDSLK